MYYIHTFSPDNFSFAPLKVALGMKTTWMKNDVEVMKDEG